MLSKVPIDLQKGTKKNTDSQILRYAILAEFDAINLYEQMAAMTEDENLKAVLLDVAKEEKTHVGEFETMLLKYDPEQKNELDHGREEVEEEILKENH